MKNLLKISLVVMLGLGIMSFYIVGTKKSDVEISGILGYPYVRPENE